MSLVIPLNRRYLSEELLASSVGEVVETLAQQLQATAVQRDRAGGHAAHERELIRQSGLLTLTIPTAHGGQGGDWSTLYRALRRLAEADSALAHLFGFHHLQLAGVRLYGSADQQSRLLRDTVAQGWFWGNALNPLDKRLLATEVEGGYLLNGIKSFASGSVGSDQLTVSAWHEATQSLLIAAVPTEREGVSVQADWDAFGQKQTDSGNVSFQQVLINRHEVLQAPGAEPTPQTTLRSQVAQLVLVNLYLGIGLGAFNEARRYNRDEARPWFASGVPASVDDPFVQHRYGELWLLLRPAVALADQAAALLDAAFHRGAELTARERGEVAIAVAEAKVLAHRAGVEVSSQLFELTGARSTSGKYGLDRFWRNVRVHTLHDPIDYKLRDVGRHVLTGAWPEPTAYS
ncbi:MAG TPA: acyl-CoA dehydrogenase family protein [Rhizobacter sp.]|nr:acyl-CoA dehydrogenase family protein [Rhizobacter sp.]